MAKTKVCIEQKFTKLNKKPLLYIFISAVLFGISTPLAKLLVKDISPIFLAGLLYLGAFTGISLYSITGKSFPLKAVKMPASKKKIYPGCWALSFPVALLRRHA